DEVPSANGIGDALVFALHRGGVAGVGEPRLILRGQEPLIDAGIQGGEQAVLRRVEEKLVKPGGELLRGGRRAVCGAVRALQLRIDRGLRSEEHTSELQSRFDLVCRLLLEKKNYLFCE